MNVIQNSLLFAFALTCNVWGQTMDSLKLALKNAKHDTTRCNILSAMVEAESDDAVWPNYNEQLIKLVEIKIKTTSQTVPEYQIYIKHYAGALNNLGYLSTINDDIPKALNYFNKSLKMQEEIGDKQGIANSLSNIGSSYRDQGDIPKTLNYYERCLKIQEEIDDKEGIATTLNNMGASYMDQGDIPKALDTYGRSLRMAEELGDKHGIARTLSNIAVIYEGQGEMPKSQDYYFRSLKIYEELGEKKGIAKALNDIGENYKDKGDFTLALDFTGRSLKIMTEIGDKKGIAEALNNLGGIYFKQGDNTRALEYYSKSLKLREERGDKFGTTQSFNNIVNIYLRQKKYPEALNYGLKSMKISRELTYPRMIRNAAMQLHKIYMATGNYKLALENYELYIQMRDSINNIETQKATIKQQSKYEYEKQKALEDEKHVAELKIQEEKAIADKKRQNTIIASVSIVLVLVAFFSVLLYNRFKTTQKQKSIIEKKEKETQEQKHVIEEKQKEILDSINYAKRIQYTLLAHETFLKENLWEHFTFFNPKDIVSGDFYWATKKDNLFYLAVCDSTGHGVPGAFMSLLNIGFLSEAINEKGIESPNDVFDYVRDKLIKTISREDQKDGFDGTLLCIDKKNKTITYASANNAPIIIQNNQIVELPSDRMPVGIGERKERFTLHTIDAHPGDLLYLYTDGFADQFGGPNGKKFKYKQLNELLVAHHSKSMHQQQLELKTAFDGWKGSLEQVDDVTIVGLRLFC